jgi:hypothetical protein
VDYVNAHGNYERIDYPNLFSIHIDTQEDLTFEHVRTRIKSLLDAKSLEINTLAVAASPTLLTGSSLSLYQYHLANSGSTLSGTTAS